MKTKIKLDDTPRFIMSLTLIIQISLMMAAASYLLYKFYRAGYTPPAVIHEKNINIITDKKRYLQTESVIIRIKNELPEKTFVTFPVMERMNSDAWVPVNFRWTPCGAAGGMIYLPIEPESSVNYLWDQKEKWCGSDPADTTTLLKDAVSGEYRLKTKVVKRTKDEKEDPNNISGEPVEAWIYSNSFAIEGMSGVNAKCREKMEGYGLCDMGKEGFQFDPDTGRCVKKFKYGCTFGASPFESLEDCQNTCEGKTDFYSCTQDSECVKVKADPCGCNAGGGAISINRGSVVKWRANAGDDQVMCPQVISNDPSCSQVPKCESGKCVLRGETERSQEMNNNN